jgi:hypothetical protein
MVPKVDLRIEPTATSRRQKEKKITAAVFSNGHSVLGKTFPSAGLTSFHDDMVRGTASALAICRIEDWKDSPVITCGR